MFGTVKTIEVVVFILYVSSFTYGSILLPKKGKTLGPPICSSYNGLCGLDYRYVSDDNKTAMVMHSDHEICTCPDAAGNTCSVGTNWNDMNNSIVQNVLSGPGLQLLVKIRYCQLPAPKRDCKFTEPVMITRGRGQFMFKLVDDMMCRCERPLVAQSSWIHGTYDYIQYGCGQPRCVKRNMSVCADVTVADGSLKSRSFCRCKRNQICNGGLPKEEGESVQHKCL